MYDPNGLISSSQNSQSIKDANQAIKKCTYTKITPSVKQKSLNRHWDTETGHQFVIFSKELGTEIKESSLAKSVVNVYR